LPAILKNQSSNAFDLQVFSKKFVMFYVKNWLSAIETLRYKARHATEAVNMSVCFMKEKSPRFNPLHPRTRCYTQNKLLLFSMCTEHHIVAYITPFLERIFEQDSINSCRELGGIQVAQDFKGHKVQPKAGFVCLS
jgi:hypothetical protein